MIKNTVISCAMFAVLISAHCIMANTVSTSGSRLHAILPSHDVSALLGSNLNSVSFNTPSIINLKTIIFNLNFSFSSDQNAPFIINQDVTMNDIPHARTIGAGTLIPMVNLHDSDDVRLFGEVNFKLPSATTRNLDIFDDGNNSFAVKTEVMTVPKPEIHIILLTGLGLLGFTARRRKHNANLKSRTVIKKFHRKFIDPGKLSK